MGLFFSESGKVISNGRARGIFFFFWIGRRENGQIVRTKATTLVKILQKNRTNRRYISWHLVPALHGK